MAAYRKKEVQIDCNVFDTKPVEIDEDDLSDDVEKMSVEGEQIGNSE